MEDFPIDDNENSLILIKKGEADFRTLTWEVNFRTLIKIGKADNLSPNEYNMKVEMLSFSGNLDSESFVDWVYKVEKFFNMAFVPPKKHVNLVAHKLKGGAVVW